MLYPTRPLIPTLALLGALQIVGCSDDSNDPANGGSPGGTDNALNDQSLAGGDAGRPGVLDPHLRDRGNAICQSLRATIRDFRGFDEPGGHRDFFTCRSDGNATPGLVAPLLGSDQKPVYADGPNVPKVYPQTSNRANFDQWYRDVDGVNIPITVELPMTIPGGMAADRPVYAEYKNHHFYPIDGQGFGNTTVAGETHNFHFTTEIATTFRYERDKNLSFTFLGDDDVWVFVNGRLALDLGGCHPPVWGHIDFNAKAEELGLLDGEVYELRVFHAERHATGSKFKIITNIQCYSGDLL